MDICTLARSFSALSDPVRLRLLGLLRTRPATCGKEMAELLGISVALASHHTKILEDARLISRRKEGQFSRFTLNAEFMKEMASALNAASCPNSPAGCEDGTSTTP